MVGVQALYEDGGGLEGPTRRDDDIIVSASVRTRMPGEWPPI